MIFFEKFCEHIKKETFINSIYNIKNAVSAIWTEDAKIVQDYTDHGLKHSERIFEKLYDLLLIDNALKSLKEDEMYILILSVILHDIGMQCDVKKHETIKSIAENKFNADFNIAFIPGTANSYSKDEQNEIRKNHHLLTAAWLYCGFFNEHAFPYNALQSVGMQYREDLINVCKFHSKLDIYDCPEISESSLIRCRFIAALLRLGDELDIDQYRVNVQTVKTFGYTPDNSIFWYIHDHTKIQIREHGIFVKIYLTENDYQVCGSVLQDIVINTFNNKNRKLTEILASNDLNIFLSNNSKVEASEYADPLPEEIRNQIVTMGKRSPDKVVGENNFDD